MKVQQTKIPQHVRDCFPMKLRSIMLYRMIMFFLTGKMKYMFFTVEGGLRFSLDATNKSKVSYWIISNSQDDPNLHAYEGTVRGFNRIVNGKPTENT